jgi:hypothetical protein
MSRSPDIDFTLEGKYPQWGTKKILRAWKVDPGRASVLEIEGGKFVLVVKDGAMGAIPFVRYLRDYRLKGFVFTADDMWVVNQHAPHWAEEWESISGESGSDSPPYWYVEKEILTGSMAFRDSYDAEKWLRGYDWAESDVGEGFWTKKVGRGVVRLYGASRWSDEIKLYAHPSRKTRAGWGEYGSPELEAKEKEFDEQTSRTLKIKGSYGKDLEDKAVEVSQAVNSFRPAPVRRVRTDEDKATAAAFLAEAREEVLNYLNTEGRDEYTGAWNEGRTTRWLSGLLVWDSGGLALYKRHFGWGTDTTYTKKDVGKLFSKLLREMEDEGLIKQYRDGPQPEWFKLERPNRRNPSKGGTRAKPGSARRKGRKLRVLDYVELRARNDTNHMWLVERGGVFFVLSFQTGSRLEYGVKGAGTRAEASRAFDQELRNLQSGTYHGEVWKVEADEMDADARKRLDVFDDPTWGLDWEKEAGTQMASEEDQFCEMLAEQVRAWKGTAHGLPVAKHPYWPKFHAMVQEAVAREYGNSIRLYRGIRGKQALPILDGQRSRNRGATAWTSDLSAARVYAAGKTKRGDTDWVVVQRNFSPEEILLAPVVLDGPCKDPDILMRLSRDVEHFGDELIVDLPEFIPGDFKIAARPRGGRSQSPRPNMKAGKMPRVQYHATSWDRVPRILQKGLQLPRGKQDASTFVHDLPSISTTDKPEDAQPYHPSGALLEVRVKPGFKYLKRTNRMMRRGESLIDAVNRWGQEVIDKGAAGFWMEGWQSTVGNQTYNPNALEVVRVLNAPKGHADVQRRFDRWNRKLKGLLPDLPPVRFTFRDDAGDGGRHFAYTVEEEGVVVVAMSPGTADLDAETVDGLVLHELGHAVDLFYKRSAMEEAFGESLSTDPEQRADEIAESLFDETIQYERPDFVQCVGDSCRGGRRPKGLR